MKKEIRYEFHHLGIPVQDGATEGIFSEKVGMYTEDNPGKFRVQWHRFTDNSPLHPLLKTLPHVAFKVSNLQEAIKGEEVILGPYEPIDDYVVAVINDSGIPIELIETTPVRRRTLAKSQNRPRKPVPKVKRASAFIAIYKIR